MSAAPPLAPTQSYGFLVPPGMPLPTNPFEEFTAAAVEQSIPARFEEQVRKYPRRLAVKSARHELTYEALNRAANGLARALLARRGPAVEPIAFLLDHGAAQVVAILGILKAGKIYAALDASFFPPAALAYLVEDLQAPVIVTDSTHLSLAEELSRGKRAVLNLDTTAEDDTDLALPIEPDRPALILYTSGSTGQPKGVVNNHRNILHYTRTGTNGLHLCPEDRQSLLASCSFAGSLGSIFGALLNGAALLMYDLKKQGLPGLARWLRDEAVTHFFAITSVFRHFAGTLTGAESFPRLRVVSLGGEAVSRRDVRQCFQSFGPDILVAVGLGATEILSLMGQFLDRDTPVDGVWVPLGYPAYPGEVLLLDEDGREAGPGEVGEIVVRSRYLALGYWRDPELTAQAFRPDPTAEGVRTYRLGDLGRRRPDGCLEYHGRRDHQVKVRGHRVNLAEVETALLEVEAVKETAVSTAEGGRGGRRLIAYVVPAAGRPCTAGNLRQALRERLPVYMVPAAFVVLDALPMTPTGKVDRQALPVPDTARPTLDAPYESPTDPTEQALVEVWEDCLNVRPVGILDGFFELGGDSLLAVDMLVEVEGRVGKKLAPSVLLGGPTVQNLARAVREDTPAATRLTEVQAGPPQRRLFFLHGDYGGGGLYCAALARRLGPEQGFYALHPHGQMGDAVPASIEAMAADHLRALVAFQPHGPYVLGGYCIGAVVAFELAQQLRRRGERVEGLLLIEPPRLPRFLPPPFTLLQRLLMSRLIARSSRKLGRLAEPERRQVVHSLHCRASANYDLRPYPGRVTILRAAEGIGPGETPRAVPSLPRLVVSRALRAVGLRAASERLLGERRRAAEGVPVKWAVFAGAVGELDWRRAAVEVTFETVPGDHFTVLTRHAPALADCLKKGLRETGGDTASPK